ncbi:MAG: DUF4097 family beta strand repeat-containing protein [Acutalibacteraceae bacterium]|nr:DUF4097 family beta strand repeat-containing protein [Acutalibacteraceae bacterium]
MSKRTKIWLITAASLVLVGCIIFGGVMTVLKWDFTKLSTVRYETNDYKINEEFKNISIVTRTADVVFVPSENEVAEVVCQEQINMKHSVRVQDGTLLVEIVDMRKWHEHIGINFGTSKITVYLPQDQYGVLSVKSRTGKIYIEKLNAEAVNLSVTTGKIQVSNVNCQGEIGVRVSTGETKLTNIRCKNLTSSGDTGDISLNNAIAAERFSIERSTGNVKLDGCDAAELLVKTNTGDVKGSLLTEKVFITKSDTGSVDVPKTVTGGRCEIITDTGDIKITINN